MAESNEPTEEPRRINHGVCLVRSVHMHAYVQCERKVRKKQKTLLGALRLVSYIHMLRQITFSPPLSSSLDIYLPLLMVGMRRMSRLHSR